MNKYKSYCVTVRPSQGVSKDSKLEKELLTWCKKQDYSCMYSEKSDEARHIHIQIWCNTPRARGAIATAVCRICERCVIDWNDAQKKVLRQGIRIAYSDWYIDYLHNNTDKDDDEGETLYSNPPDNSIDFYPTESEQELIQDNNNACDKRFHKLNALWNIHYKDKEKTITNTAKFLCDMMFKSKIIQVIGHQKNREQLCLALWAYLNEQIVPDLFLSKDLENRYTIVEAINHNRDHLYELITEIPKMNK